ncbi:hypothetical protein R2601_03178 [Salipiger bermudensis HTCC2601]|uniref:Uncharacterized protein n=1 Tax=Salipiger bermudensis (strain DSM 26914 / JCM 13377 / KCTC 12554 / HTCC2601) TaxID=314265 RepID=Q0FWL0_SALBH|nr:hypothetical protein R2601_03178 [Salipiger bermudensis HTCC2601]
MLSMLNSSGSKPCNVPSAAICGPVSRNRWSRQRASPVALCSSTSPR